jgi:Lon protease-like protein
MVQVTRAVRLRDGKLLVLATALGRFRVVRAVRELPYSEAHVELLEDVEVLESFGEAATAALMQVRVCVCGGGWFWGGGALQY